MPMKLTGADIQRMADDTELRYRRYSGRGMFGRECPSVYADSLQDLYQLIEQCDEIEQAVELLRYCHTDSMGHGLVIYWPSMRLEPQASQ